AVCVAILLSLRADAGARRAAAMAAPVVPSVAHARAPGRRDSGYARGVRPRRRDRDDRRGVRDSTPTPCRMQWPDTIGWRAGPAWPAQFEARREPWTPTRRRPRSA